MKWGMRFINAQSFSRSFSSLRDVKYEWGKWYDTTVLLECDASCLFVTYQVRQTNFLFLTELQYERRKLACRTLYIASAQTEEYATAFKYLFKH
jgi:hypothetical protein